MSWGTVVGGVLVVLVLVGLCAAGWALRARIGALLDQVREGAEARRAAEERADHLEGRDLVRDATERELADARRSGADGARARRLLRLEDGATDDAAPADPGPAA